MRLSINQLKRLTAALALPLLAVVALSTGPGAAYTASDDVAALYKSKCAGCHGADGAGDTPAGKKMGARSFKAPEVKGQSDEVLLNVTLKGKNKMPGYEKSLGADKCKSLVAYIRQNLMK